MTNRVLGGAVVVTVVLATISAVVASRRDAMVAAPKGPVAAVQTSLSAVVDGRTDEAARWLGPSGTSGFSERHTFTLRTVEGAWRLTGTPWPLVSCYAGG